MAHLGAREEIGGEVVQTTSFVMRKGHCHNYNGTYCRLIEPNTQQGKEDMFLAGEKRFIAQQDSFEKIPGNPVAYWVRGALLNTFIKGVPVSNMPRKIWANTGDNNRFLRLGMKYSIGILEYR